MNILIIEIDSKTEPFIEINGTPKIYEKPNLRIKIPISKEGDDSIQTPAVKRINSEKYNCIGAQEKISLAFIICTYLLCCPCILKNIC